MARKYKSPYRVLPDETGGLTTFQAKEVIEKMLEQLNGTVDVGHWTAAYDTHKKLGTIDVRLQLSIWKKGWSPPQEAIDAALADEAAKTIKAIKAKTKKDSSTKAPKKAR